MQPFCGLTKATQTGNPEKGSDLIEGHMPFI
jgi:hypothetical protein